MNFQQNYIVNGFSTGYILLTEKNLPTLFLSEEYKKLLSDDENWRNILSKDFYQKFNSVKNIKFNKFTVTEFFNFLLKNDFYNEEKKEKNYLAIKKALNFENYKEVQIILNKNYMNIRYKRVAEIFSILKKIGLEKANQIQVYLTHIKDKNLFLNQGLKLLSKDRSLCFYIEQIY